MSESFEEILSRLRTDFPGVKLLALGQTVYWDEPVKAILRRLLDKRLPEAVMAIGIHDADYFSKIPSDLDLEEGWYILPHNDGATRDLWVATGEISRMFGSETVPTRDLLSGYGAQVDKVARDNPAGRDALVNTATEAWGWRGLVHVNSESEISCCVPLRDALPNLLELLSWGFSHTLESLADSAQAERGRRMADELLGEAKTYADSHPDASITDMFGDFLIRFYERLLGYRPANLESTSVTEVFKFNASTSGLPRFRLLCAFLNPETRGISQEAYDLALEGSDIHTLDRFSPGAIPFDLVVPGRGRGTISLRDGEVSVDFDEPVSIPVDNMPATCEELASVIEGRFGRDTALIGKALTLVLMMASEFIFVLHEQASAYVPYCEKMAMLLKERGVAMPFFPILRMGLHTWDSLSECDATFALPGHLAAAFRQGEITAREFAHTWRAAVGEQETLLEKSASLTGTEDLLLFLAEQQGKPWDERAEAYRQAYTSVRELSEHTEPMKSESVHLRDLSHQIKQEVQALEMEKGEHFRREVKPLRDRLDILQMEGGTADPEYPRLAEKLDREEKKRAEIEARIDQRRAQAQEAHNRSLDLKHAVRSLETGEDARKARDVIKTIEYEAELARLWLVRDALLTSGGLKYTDRRPSAWWFLLADPELRWFNRVAETAEFRFEEID